MPLDSHALEKFRQTFTGRLLSPADPGYDEARTVWNGMFDRKPALIARCAHAEDVARAIAFARENDLPISVKGGGHNSAGLGVGDGTLTIDLAPMRKVTLEAQHHGKNGGRAVRVEGGALLSDLDAATSKEGLAVSSGIISGTGVGGLTLGGGFGWISRKHGLSVDNLLEAEVVTAEGRKIKASQEENPDLHWALRGGGGNFGVVTSFRFRAADIGREVYSGVLVKRFEDAAKYLRFHRDYVRQAPDELTAWNVIRLAPPLPFLPEEVHGRRVLLVPFVWLGDPEEGARIIEPLRAATPSLGEGIGMHPWTAWQSTFDALNAPGARNYWKSHHLKVLDEACIETILLYAEKAPTAECEIFIPHMEGAPSRVPLEETAYPHRTTPFILNLHTRWREPEDDARCQAWARDFHDATRPYAQGVYVNFLSAEGAERVREAYTPAVWKRLAETKKRWDPENVFRMNQNIEPE